MDPPSGSVEHASEGGLTVGGSEQMSILVDSENHLNLSCGLESTAPCPETYYPRGSPSNSQALIIRNTRTFNPVWICEPLILTLQLCTARGLSSWFVRGNHKVAVSCTAISVIECQCQNLVRTQSLPFCVILSRRTCSSLQQLWLRVRRHPPKPLQSTSHRQGLHYES